MSSITQLRPDSNGTWEKQDICPNVIPKLTSEERIYERAMLTHTHTVQKYTYTHTCTHKHKNKTHRDPLQTDLGTHA